MNLTDYGYAVLDTALSIHPLIWVGMLLLPIVAHFAQQDRDAEQWQPTHHTIEVEAVQS